MFTREIGKNLYLIDLETGGIKNLIGSYIIKGAKTTIIESGPSSSVPRLLEGLRELEVNPNDVEYVAITHVHLDHGGGVGTLLKSLPNAKVIVHPRGLQHLVDPSRLWASAQTVLGFVSDIFGEPEPVPKERVIPVSDGNFDLGEGAALTVFETLGHASHNLSFQESLNEGIFPGDAAGTYVPEINALVPTTPPPFRLESALVSLDKLISLEPTALYYSHFGKATNGVQRLLDYKLQLQLWAKIIVEGVRENHTDDQIRNRIIAEDKVLREHVEFFRNHSIYSKTVLGNTIHGFIEWAKEKRAVDSMHPS